jgi:hypothetical protein
MDPRKLKWPFQTSNKQSPLLLFLLALILIRHFILYSFDSEETIVAILTQNNLKGEELPIYFMRKTLHDYELKYSTIEKQAFSLVKEIAHFRTYILSAHVVSYVPHSPVKMFLNQQFKEGRWENWLAKLQEYDIEIKLSRLC